MPMTGNLYLQARPLPWTADSCIPSCLDSISTWIANLTCPKLNSLLHPKNLLILQLPHFSKWQLHSSNCSGQSPQPISNSPSNSVVSAFKMYTKCTSPTPRLKSRLSPIQEYCWSLLKDLIMPCLWYSLNSSWKVHLKQPKTLKWLPTFRVKAKVLLAYKTTYALSGLLLPSPMTPLHLSSTSHSPQSLHWAACHSSNRTGMLQPQGICTLLPSSSNALSPNSYRD